MRRQIFPPTFVYIAQKTGHTRRYSPRSLFVIDVLTEIGIILDQLRERCAALTAGITNQKPTGFQAVASAVAIDHRPVLTTVAACKANDHRFPLLQVLIDRFQIQSACHAFVIRRPVKTSRRCIAELFRHCIRIDGLTLPIRLSHCQGCRRASDLPQCLPGGTEGHP